MEIKKSPKADLERKKPLWFFIALLINISLFLFVLEYSPSESDVSVENITKSVENMVETTEMIAAEETAPAQPKKNIVEENRVSDEIEVVEKSDVSEFIPPLSVAGNDSIIMTGADIEDEKPIEREDVITDLKMLEQLPSYPGGMSKFVRWLTDNLKYPQKARDQRLQGLVVASFIINEDGSIDNISIRTPLSDECDKEVIRVLGKMEIWTPGKRNGKACRTLFCIPVEFKL